MEVGHDSGFYEEEIIPDGHVEIIFYLNGDCKSKQYDANDWLAEPNAFIAAQTLKCHEVKMAAGARLYGIRFYPHTLYPFLRIPLDHIENGFLPLGDVINTAGFWNCITEVPVQTFSNLENYLGELISRQTLNSPGFQYVNSAVRTILESSGTTAVSHIIENNKISNKYHGDLFKKYVGITPKSLCNILRINRFISNKITFPDLSLTECTYESGYFDQSHLIKSFRQFTAISPREYFADKHAISNIFSLL